MINNSYANLKFAAYSMIVVHLLLVMLHAASHQFLEVDLTTLQLSFIVIVIIAAPLVAGLLLRKWRMVGSILLTLSMAGSFLFGAYNHFVAHSMDHVAEVAHLQPEIWATLFRWSAGGLAITEAAGAFLGVWLMAAGQPKLETHAA
jgi:hypothetical protein